MKMTLHLTSRCNLACSYCYQQRGVQDMSVDTALSAVELGRKNGNSGLFCFFGGEPLLKKDIIRAVTDRCREYRQRYEGYRTDFKLVTNGVLIDEDYIRLALDEKIVTAVSHDGIGQDLCRRFPDGRGSSDIVERNAKLLLSAMPQSIVMMTVSPAAVERFAESVEYLYSLGFRRIITTPVFGRECVWDDDTAEKLRRQYDKIADRYIKKILSGEQVYFSEFEDKIRRRVEGEAYPHKSCRLGERQVSVMPDGKIYPCLQFIGEAEWEMGNVYDGIDPRRLRRIKERREGEVRSCLECALRDRCRYNCACLNRQCTGNLHEVSPFQCLHEQMVIFSADKAANALYEKGSPIFGERWYDGYT